MSDMDGNSPEVAASEGGGKGKSAKVRLCAELLLLAVAVAAVCVVAERRDLKWWCYLKAHCGSAEAQYKLSEHCGNEEDTAGAMKWLHRAAEGGSVSAQLELYRRYRIGYMVERDESTAINWLRKAAESGDPEAMFQMGAYCMMPGPKRSEAEAKRWLEKAAAAGYRPAGEILDGMAAAPKRGAAGGR